MPIQTGDIKLLASKVMADVPEGGGGPTSVQIVDGASNNLFEDISELDRAGGKVSMRKLHVSVQTNDTGTYLGGNIIVAEPPNDPNVSVTIFSTGDTFDTRADAQNRVESYLIRGPLWAGFLFERHVKGQRSIQICQRPGTPMPPIGRTLCLVHLEDVPGEVEQYVRVTRATAEGRLAYDPDTKEDFPVQVVTCDLSDSLRFDFPGTAANRSFSSAMGASIIRDTTVANAASYYGVVPLQIAAAIGDVAVRAQGVHTQLVPSARTEAIALDQKPAAQRSFVLASAPRRIEVSLAPHSMRMRVGQENRSFSWTAILKPNPAPGTVVVSFRALGAWYTLQDDGEGNLTGAGVGTVNYATGSIAVTLPSLPDVGSSLIYSWGERTAFTDRKNQAGFRAPEYAFAVAQLNLKPGTVVVKWTSAGVLKTATDDGAGQFTGDATGEANYAAGKLRLKLAAMIDAGGQFEITYQHTTTITKSVTGASPDAGGFVTVALDDVPVQGTLLLTWYTVRNVSNTSGANAGSVVKGETLSLGALPPAEVTNTNYSGGRPASNTPQGFPTATGGS